jgi:hypothetical protein
VCNVIYIPVIINNNNNNTTIQQYNILHKKQTQQAKTETSKQTRKVKEELKQQTNSDKIYCGVEHSRARYFKKQEDIFNLVRK